MEKNHAVLLLFFHVFLFDGYYKFLDLLPPAKKILNPRLALNNVFSKKFKIISSSTHLKSVEKSC